MRKEIEKERKKMRSLIFSLIMLTTVPVFAQTNMQDRGKNILANIKNNDLTQPTQAYYNKVTTAIVYTSESSWRTFLASKGYVVNSSDLLDIGTVDEEGVFTPADNTTKNRLRKRHYIYFLRDLHKRMLLVYAVKHAPVDVKHAGKSPEQILKDVQTDETMDADTNLGTDASDSDN